MKLIDLVGYGFKRIIEELRNNQAILRDIERNTARSEAHLMAMAAIMADVAKYEKDSHACSFITEQNVIRILNLMAGEGKDEHDGKPK